MNKKLYLLTLGLLILFAALSIFQGSRYIMSPVGIFQLASLANIVLPLVLGVLLTVFLSVRFADVLKNRASVDYVASRPIARASQNAGKFLILVFYVLLVVVIGFLIIARGQLGGEIGFLFGPLFRTLPIGLLLFELGRILDNSE